MNSRPISGSILSPLNLAQLCWAFGFPPTQHLACTRRNRDFEFDRDEKKKEKGSSAMLVLFALASDQHPTSLDIQSFHGLDGIVLES